MKKPAVAAALLVLPAIGMWAGGCAGQGHGDYVEEGISLAEQRMLGMKAAIEYDMARQAFLAGDLDKAERKVGASIKINDQVARSHVLQARVQIERGDMGGAVQTLRLAETLDPVNVEVQYYLGVVHERLTRRAEALAFFQRAAELEPYEEQYPIAAAEMLIDLDRIADAEAYLRGHPAFEHSPGMRQTLGHAALIRGDRPAAMSLFEEARLLAPDDPAIIEDLAQVQIDMGQFGKAEQNIRELLAEKGNEDRADLRRSLIDCMLGQQRFAEARRMLETMTEAPTGADAETWLALGKVCLQMNDDRGARRASARAAALSPSWVEPHMLQAMVHRRSGAYEAALVAVDRALQIDPRNASAHAIRGLVLTDMGRQAEASRAFAEAAEIDPTNPSFKRFNDPAIATVPTDGE